MPIPPSPPKETIRSYDAEELRRAICMWVYHLNVALSAFSLQPDVLSRFGAWAYLSEQGHLRVSSDILLLSRDLAEFAILHALIEGHLQKRQHLSQVQASRAAKDVVKARQRLMGAWLPDWKERAQRLQLWQETPGFMSA